MADQSSTSSDNTKRNNNDKTNKNLCWTCQKQPIAYQPQSCDCAIYCKGCAMKFATGGVCKQCHQRFGGMKRVVRDIVESSLENE